MTKNSSYICNSFQSDRVAVRAARYLQGAVCLDVGCGQRKVWPSVIGIDDMSMSGQKSRPDMVADGTRLEAFSTGNVDAIFSSFFLNELDSCYPCNNGLFTTMRRFADLVKVNGYIVLFIPSNMSHINDAVEDISYSGNYSTRDHYFFMNIVEDVIINDEGEEEGRFIVLKKELEKKSVTNVTAKRALVIRYGAIGDMIQTAMLFPALKDQGYHITVNCNEVGAEVIKNNPFVDDVMMQRSNFVPSKELLPYWNTLATMYDKVINLSESVEGALLALPGRMLWNYSDAVRDSIVGKINYFDHMCKIAEVSTCGRVSFFPTNDELVKAQNILKDVKGFNTNRPVILWCVNGSGPDKIYPYAIEVIKEIIKTTNAVVILSGSGVVSREVSNVICEAIGMVTYRLFNCVDKLDLRVSLTLAGIVDCVVGPETGITNCAAYHKNGKVLLLSHSSRDNLSRDWTNTKSLSAPNHIPSHKLHKDWNDCEQDSETGASVCMSGIKADVLVKAIKSSLLKTCKRNLVTKG